MELMYILDVIVGITVIIHDLIYIFDSLEDYNVYRHEIRQIRLDDWVHNSQKLNDVGLNVPDPLDPLA